MSSELRATLAISQSEALNGTSRTLTLPGGQKVTVKVPAGAYSGQLIQVGGQGYGASAETLLLTLVVVQPETSPSTHDSSQELPTISTSSPYAQNPPATPPTPNHYYQNPPTSTPNQYGQNQFTAPTPATPTYTVPATNQPQAAPPLYTQQESDIAPPPPPPPIQIPPALPPTPARTAAARSPFASGRAILLIGLALLVIAGGVGLFFVIHGNQEVFYANATATANTAATVMVNDSNATASAQAGSNAATASASSAAATAQAQAAATAAVIAHNPDPYAGGTLALYDPLHDANSSPNWSTGSDNQGGSCAFTGGAYHVSESNLGTAYECFNSSSDFSNFAYEVQMQIMKGDAGGLLFRANTTNNTNYIFYVGQDGSYELLVCPSKTCHDLVKSSISSVIRQGLGQTNTVAVLVQGNTITLYVNNQKITSVTDSTLSHGEIGVVASPFTTGGHATDVAYSNAKVWTL